MPHVGNSSTEDLASSDEIKVFKDEGEDEKRASADLTDLKSSLITEGDQEKTSQTFSSKSSTSQQSSAHLPNGQRAESTTNFGKAFESPLGYSPFSYPLPHTAYHPNGTLGQMANKMAAAAAMVGTPHSGSSLPYMMPNMERFPQPPPAHMGIPPVHIETKAVSISAWMDLELPGFPRNPLYNLSGHGQYSHSVLSDLTQQLQWPNPAMYQLQSAAFRGPYSPLPSVSSSTFPGFGRTPLMPHPSLSGHSFPHPSFLPSATSTTNNGTTNNLTNTTNGHKTASKFSPPTNSNGRSSHLNGANSPQTSSSIHRLLGNNSDSANHNHNNNNNDSSVSNKNRSNSVSTNHKNSNDKHHHNQSSKNSPNSPSQAQSDLQMERDQSKSHIKKPLNAFMIYMKEMRAKVIAESTLKESAAINQILGKRWHLLSRTEQQKYYDKARKERELHMELHPGWTAKDNYAINGKRKKKKRERNADGERGALKKCRARYGLEQQNHWCKPCRRKKKCIRYLEAARAAANGENRTENDDNLGSVGSVEVPTPESKSANESDHDNLNLSSNDLSLSSPPTSDYHHHFLNSFNHFQNAPSINSPNNSQMQLNGHSNGHLSSSSLFYPHQNSSTSTSLSSPIGSRMSLLTPNSPLASSFSPASLMPPTQPSSLNQTSQMPPRNSPFSIEQLARPHCPQSRGSPLPSPYNPHTSLLNGSNSNKNSITVSVITQLPTPPSSTDSASATPAMLSVA